MIKESKELPSKYDQEEGKDPRKSGRNRIEFKGFGFSIVAQGQWVYDFTIEIVKNHSIKLFLMLILIVTVCAICFGVWLWQQS